MVMKEIPLSLGLVALVDDEDFTYLSQWAWYAKSNRYKSFYVKRTLRVNGKSFYVAMHRQILGAPPGVIVDHANRNTLDNRKLNLRFATTHQNMCNRIAVRSRFGYRGVKQRRSGHGKWEARISLLDGTRRHLGSFETAEDAARAYDEAAKRAHGEFAVLNFPD